MEKLLMDKSKIAIISTVINFELYEKSAALFPQEIQKYIIDGRNGMHGIKSICFMMEKLKSKGIEWLVMADEDVLFVKSESIFSLIRQMEHTGENVCGIRDGGVIVHRKYNPFAINTFFSIIHLGDIEKIWNQKEMLRHQYIIKSEFQDSILELPYEYDVKSLYEPYYCFYFWLRRKGNRILFLESEMASDGITNTIKNNEGEIIAYHTWYARSYGTNENHTDRIDLILKKIAPGVTGTVSPIVYKDGTFALREKIMKLWKRIMRKLVIQ